MAKYTVVTTQGNPTEFEVHTAECRDLNAPRLRRYDRHTEEHESAETLVTEWVAEFAECEQDWFADDFRVMPCCKKK